MVKHRRPRTDAARGGAQCTGGSHFIRRYHELEQPQTPASTLLRSLRGFRAGLSTLERLRAKSGLGAGSKPSKASSHRLQAVAVVVRARETGVCKDDEIGRIRVPLLECVAVGLRVHHND